MRDARPADPRGEHREAARARARAARARVARLRGDRAHPARAAVLRSARPRLGQWGARKRPRVSVEHGGPRNGPPSPPAAVFRPPWARLRDGHAARPHRLHDQLGAADVRLRDRGAALRGDDRARLPHDAADDARALDADGRAGERGAPDGVSHVSGARVGARVPADLPHVRGVLRVAPERGGARPEPRHGRPRRLGRDLLGAGPLTLPWAPGGWYRETCPVDPGPNSPASYSVTRRPSRSWA